MSGPGCACGGSSAPVRLTRAELARFGDAASKQEGATAGGAVGTAVGAFYGNPAVGAAVGGFVGGVIGGLIGGKDTYDCSFFSANWPDLPLNPGEAAALLPKSIRDAVGTEADNWAHANYQTWSSDFQQTVDGCFPNLGSMYEGVRVRLLRATAAGIANAAQGKPMPPLPVPPPKPGSPADQAAKAKAKADAAWTTGEKVAVGTGVGVVVIGGVLGAWRAVTGRWPWQPRRRKNG